MKSKVIMGIMLAMLFIGMLMLAFDIQPSKAELGTIYIRANGAIEPSTANITSADNVTYTFTGNIFNQSIVVERDNIVIDGAGYTIEGTGASVPGSMGINVGLESNVSIKNMKIKKFGNGINLYEDSNNTISGNNITNTSIGIALWNSSNNIICGNNITDSGSGIWLAHHSSSNVLRGNSMANNSYNFGIELCWLEYDFLNDVDTSNTVDGKPIYYWINERDMAVPLDAGYVALVNCTRITVKNLNLANNMQGVLLAWTTNSTITENIITNNGYHGIWLDYSSNNNVYGNNITASTWYGIELSDCSNYNTISRNNIIDNYDGILLSASSNNNISRNNITTNSYVGIELYSSSNYNTISGNNITDSANCGIGLIGSSNNIIYHNNFINLAQVYATLTNTWDNGYPSGGNYWSDYTGVDANMDGIGDTPYTEWYITDRYPLMGPFGPLTMGGENTTVFPTDDVGLIFENVTAEGFTTVNKTEIGPEPPLGFKLAEQYYEIETTANYSGKIKIRIIYDDSNMTQWEEALHLMQWNESSQQWVDITTRVDTESNIIFGESYHLSKFTIMFRTVPVGGIYISANKLNLLAPYIGLTILLAAAVVTVGYVKKRKRKYRD